jgi:hypothetical protein
MGLDHRRQDEGGEIRRKSGKMRVWTLRGIYGAGFAKGFCADTHLRTPVKHSRCESLHVYLMRHHW